jgi:CRP/FNR family transcriptional regulator, cyclic AMP receptor protein
MSAFQNLSPELGDESGANEAQDMFAGYPFLRDLNPAYVRRLVESAMRIRFSPGELIFREGDPANRFYLIEQGRVSLESHRRDEAPVAVQVIGPGEVLGWSWLFPPYYWNFDARALEPTTAIFFYGTRLREQCEQDHAFGYEMIKRMSQVVIGRLQATRKKLLPGR